MKRMKDMKTETVSHSFMIFMSFMVNQTDLDRYTQPVLPLG